MSKNLVAFFSAEGATARVANVLAETVGADIYEIKPALPYSQADLDWRNEKSRSSAEMADAKARPSLADKDLDVAKYDVIFVGFPIWWQQAPKIIATFLESYDFSGKTLIPFATSGSSEIGRTTEILQAICPAAKWIKGRVFGHDATKEHFKYWISTLDI